jgi:hypothetical protein
MRHLKAQGKILSPRSRDMAPGRPVMLFGLQVMREHGTEVLSCSAWGGVAGKLAHLDEGDMVEVFARPQTQTRVGRKPTTTWVVTEYKLLKTKPQ